MVHISLLTLIVAKALPFLLTRISSLHFKVSIDILYNSDLNLSMVSFKLTDFNLSYNILDIMIAYIILISIPIVVKFIIFYLSFLLKNEELLSLREGKNFKGLIKNYIKFRSLIYNFNIFVSILIAIVTLISLGLFIIKPLYFIGESFKIELATSLGNFLSYNLDILIIARVFSLLSIGYSLTRTLYFLYNTYICYFFNRSIKCYYPIGESKKFIILKFKLLNMFVIVEVIFKLLYILYNEYSIFHPIFGILFTLSLVSGILICIINKNFNSNFIFDYYNIFNTKDGIKDLTISLLFLLFFSWIFIFFFMNNYKLNPSTNIDLKLLSLKDQLITIKEAKFWGSLKLNIIEILTTLNPIRTVYCCSTDELKNYSFDSYTSPIVIEGVPLTNERRVIKYTKLEYGTKEKNSSTLKVNDKAIEIIDRRRKRKLIKGSPVLSAIIESNYKKIIINTGFKNNYPLCNIGNKIIPDRLSSLRYEGALIVRPKDLALQKYTPLLFNSLGTNLLEFIKKTIKYHNSLSINNLLNNYPPSLIDIANHMEVCLTANPFCITDYNCKYLDLASHTYITSDTRLYNQVFVDSSKYYVTNGEKNAKIDPLLRKFELGEGYLGLDRGLSLDVFPFIRNVYNNKDSFTYLALGPQSFILKESNTEDFALAAFEDRNGIDLSVSSISSTNNIPPQVKPTLNQRKPIISFILLEENQSLLNEGFFSKHLYLLKPKLFYSDLSSFGSGTKPNTEGGVLLSLQTVDPEIIKNLEGVFKQGKRGETLDSEIIRSSRLKLKDFVYLNGKFEYLSSSGLILQIDLQKEPGYNYQRSDFFDICHSIYNYGFQLKDFEEGSFFSEIIEGDASTNKAYLINKIEKQFYKPTEEQRILGIFGSFKHDSFAYYLSAILDMQKKKNHNSYTNLEVNSNLAYTKLIEAAKNYHPVNKISLENSNSVKALLGSSRLVKLNNTTSLILVDEDKSYLDFVIWDCNSEQLKNTLLRDINESQTNFSLSLERQIKLATKAIDKFLASF